MKKIIFILSVLLLPLTVVAYEGPISFQINDILVSTSDNRYFRVFSADGSNWHCDGGPIPGESHVDYSDPAAKAKISALMLAFTTQKDIDVWTQQVSLPDLDGDGVYRTYCQIMRVKVY